jgi:integrase
MNKIWVNSYENKKGVRWQYKFEIPGTNGKRKFINKAGFLKKKDALEAGQKALSIYLTKGKTYATNISYGDFLDKWIEDEAKSRCKDSTVVGYQKKIKNLIKPTLKNYKVKDINRQMLIDLLRMLYDKGYSYNTISGVKGILSSSFRYAVNSDLIPYSPAVDLISMNKGCKAPMVKTRLKPNHYITKEQMDKILERFPEGNPSHLPLMIAYHCGLRLGEVYALTWEDIDFENKTLSVNRQIQWMQDTNRSDADKIMNNGSKDSGKGYWYFTEPKYRSYRTIDIDDELLVLLERTRKRNEVCRIYTGPSYIKYYSENSLIHCGSKNMAIEPDNKIVNYYTDNEINFIMTREDGSYISPRTKMHMTQIIKHQLGIEDFTFHSLRHTHGTMLRDAGCPEIYISNRLGHTKIETTIQIYTNHLTKAVKAMGNNALSNLF